MSHQASKQSTREVKWALGAHWGRHTRPTFTSSAMLVPVSSWSTGRWYCLTAVTLQGAGSNCGYALCIPARQASLHAIGDETPLQRFATLGLAEHLSPKCLQGLRIYAQYTQAQGVIQVSWVRTQPYCLAAIAINLCIRTGKLLWLAVNKAAFGTGVNLSHYSVC